MIGWVNEDETPRYVPKHHVDHHIAIKELVIQLAKEGMKKNKFIVSKDSNHYFFQFTQHYFRQQEFIYYL